jgi:hypothetical protein
MRRRSLIALIAVGVVVFLVISGLLARGFSVGGAEQAAVENLVTAEAKGDPAAVAKLIDGCQGNAACQQRASTNAHALVHPGTISVVELTPGVSFALGGATGTERVAWLAGNSLPRVQCVTVRRTGSVLQGFTIRLLHVSVRIKSSADCPRSY